MHLIGTIFFALSKIHLSLKLLAKHIEIRCSVVSNTFFFHFFRLARILALYNSPYILFFMHNDNSLLSSLLNLDIVIMRKLRALSA